jgi:ABC-2 type transport system ATP-binding protein
MAFALSINNLEKTYATGTKALKGVSFDVVEGELFALLGANGAGKTTLIGILTGLVKKTGGSATVFGIDLDKEPEKVRSMIGVVPQEFNFSIFEKVLDIVVDAAGYYGIPRSEAVPRAEQILKDLGLFEKRNAVSRTLSGGMKRRLLIARALVHQPKLLLLDEPSAGVDVELRREMWEFVQKLNAAGTTVILTTHYLEEAERLCKNVVLIKEGIVAEHGGIKELMTKTGAHTLEDFYLHVNKRV